MHSLLTEMGYRAVPELQSRAVSVIQLDVEDSRKGAPSPQPETEKPVCGCKSQGIAHNIAQSNIKH